MVDVGRLAALLDRIAAEVAELETLRGWPDDRLLADGLALPAIKYRFIVAIEARSTPESM